MIVKLKINGGRESELTIGEGETIAQVLDRLGINRETVLVRLNGEIRTEEERLGNGDEVMIIRAITGG